MFQIPTKIEPAYTAGNVLTLNQRKIQPALHRGNILSVNLKKTLSGHVQENPKRTQAYRHPEPAPVTPTVSSVSSAPQKHDIPVLRNVIQKGQKVRIGTVGQFPKVRVALGWNVSNPQCDIDLSAYLLDASGKVPGDDWFVFYGQKQSPDKSTSFSLSQGADREMISIDLSRLSPSVSKIVFVLTINEALEKHLNFSMIQDAWVRVLDSPSDQEIVSFQMDEYYSNVTSMMIGEIYLYHGTWKFNAVGNGVARDLAGLCELYGVQTA